MSKIKDIHELYNIYKGKPFWLVGSDPTLDSYPDTFLDEKIGITLHLAHIKFPRSTFRYSSEYDRSEYLLRERPEYAQLPLIASLPFYGKTKQESLSLLDAFTNVYLHNRVSYLPNGVRGEVRVGFTEKKIRKTLRGKASIWGAHGSCLHTAIYMAVLLGASEIHVIGSGHGLHNYKGKDHFSAADDIHQNMRVGDTFSNAKIAFPVIEQTLALKDACEINGIPFYWHEQYTKSMDSLITVSDETLNIMRSQSKKNIPLIKTLYRFFWKRPFTRLFISWR